MKIRPDDLLLLLELARQGSFASAGAALGLDHTTVSRRVSLLEKTIRAPVVTRSSSGCTLTELGRQLLDSAERVERAVNAAEETASTTSGRTAQLAGLVRITAPEAFSAIFVAPVVARVHQQHPRVRVELITGTRPLVQGIGSDIEIGVGAPASPRLKTIALTWYTLGLYASPAYLKTRGTPNNTNELSEHSLIYYVDSLLRVDDLDLFGDTFPIGSAHIGSTSVHSQVHTTLAGGGIGMLPCFLANRFPGLNRILTDTVNVRLQFRAVLAQPALRRPPTTLVFNELMADLTQRQKELAPH